MKLSKICLLSVAGALMVTSALAIETTAKNVLVMDYDTGEYLYEKDAYTPIPPASMSKLMTIYLLFSKIKDGSLSLEDTFTVSENAWRKGGAASGSSTMFLPIGSSVSVEDLIRGILIQSGNDACIVVAENIAGSEEDFAVMMNEKARELGLKNSHFENSTGWPSPEHKMSVEDLAILARHIIKEFPELYPIFSEKTFTYHNIVQGNRNPLLYTMNDADGLKTGHTEEAGFCLTASAKRGDRRIISVMSGMSSNKERSEEAEKMMNWAFREFNNYKVFKQFERVLTVPVYMGVEKTVDLVAKEDVVVTLPRNMAKDAKLTANYTKPIKAPIMQGDKLGEVVLSVEGQKDKIIPLYADHKVEKLGFFGRIKGNISYFFFGK